MPNFANSFRGHTSLAYANPGYLLYEKEHNLSEMRHLLQRMDRMALQTKETEAVAPMYNDLMDLKVQMLGLMDKIQPSSTLPQNYLHPYTVNDIDLNYRQALLDQSKYLTDPLVRD